MPATAPRRCLALALVFTAVSVGFAGHGQHWALHWGRWSGYGWGDGYHARDEVPPRRPHPKHAAWMNWPAAMHGAPIVPPPPLKNVEVLPLPLPLPPPDAPIELEGSR